MAFALGAALGFALFVGVTTPLMPDAKRCDGHVPNDWREQVAHWRAEPERAAFWRRETDDVVRICPAVPRVPGGPQVGWKMELAR